MKHKHKFDLQNVLAYQHKTPLNSDQDSARKLSEPKVTKPPKAGAPVFPSAREASLTSGQKLHTIFVKVKKQIEEAEYKIAPLRCCLTNPFHPNAQ